MSRTDLHQLLEALRAAVQDIAASDQEAKANIDALIAALERQIKTPNDVAGSASVIANARSSIEQFETVHPRVTAILNELMMILSGIGI